MASEVPEEGVTAWDLTDAKQKGMSITEEKDFRADCEAILELLEDNGPLRQQAIRRELFLSDGQARRRLRRLRDQDKVDTFRDGRQVYYQPTEEDHA